MDIGIIGGADGPTAIFLAGDLTDYFNIFGLVIMVIIMIPNIIFSIKFKKMENKCNSKAMNILEQIGRYACMLLMIVCIGMPKFGFGSIEEFLIYFMGNIGLLLIYIVIWILFFIRQKPWKSMALAIVPTIIFLLSGITLRHTFLIIAAVIFGVAHIYVTYKNTRR